jgi:DedD protein
LNFIMPTTKSLPLDETAAIDTMRRRGRRRLIGAIVLALIAVIVIPILLRKTPEPAQSPNLKITVDKTTQTAAAQPKTTVAQGATSAATPKPAQKPVPPAVPKSANSGADLTSVKALEEPAPVKMQTDDNLSVKSEKHAPTAKTATNHASSRAARTASSSENARALPKALHIASGRFVIQVAAYRDDKGAQHFAAKLRKAGFPAYTVPDLGAKTIWRVRVGAYATLAEAEHVRAELHRKHFKRGIVVKAK